MLPHTGPSKKKVGSLAQRTWQAQEDSKHASELLNQAAPVRAMNTRLLHLHRHVQPLPWFTANGSHQALPAFAGSCEGIEDVLSQLVIPLLDILGKTLSVEAKSGAHACVLGCDLLPHKYFVHPLMFVYDATSHLPSEDVCMEHDDCYKKWKPSRQGVKNHQDGYLRIKVGKQIEYAHRLLCWAFHGPCTIDDPVEGLILLQVCHTCRNCRCMNPRHLRWGTPTQNSINYQWKPMSEA